MKQAVQQHGQGLPLRELLLQELALAELEEEQQK